MFKQCNIITNNNYCYKELNNKFQPVGFFFLSFLIVPSLVGHEPDLKDIF